MIGVVEALRVVKKILEASKEVKEAFRCQWDNILETYEQDLVELNNVLEELPQSLSVLTQMKEIERIERKKNLKKKKFVTTPNDRQLSSKITNLADKFTLSPPICDRIHDNDMRIIDGASSVSVSTSTKKINSKGNRLSNEQKRKRMQKVKMQAREIFFETIQEIREYEKKMEQRLSNPCTKDQKTFQREELEFALEKCRKRNGELTAKLISQYKPYLHPKNTGVVNSNASLGTSMIFKRLDIALTNVGVKCNKTSNEKAKSIHQDTYDIGSDHSKKDDRSSESIVKKDPYQ